MRIVIASVAALMASVAFAQQSQPAQPAQDMIISREALTQLGAEINETPLKYANPILQILQKGLRPLPAPEPSKPAEAPKSEVEK